MSLIENAIEKSIQVTKEDVASESEEDFEERMKVAEYLKRANDVSDNFSKIVWPKIKIDTAIPF
jgi:hypothetical protein